MIDFRAEICQVLAIVNIWLNMLYRNLKVYETSCLTQSNSRFQRPVAP